MLQICLRIAAYFPSNPCKKPHRKPAVLHKFQAWPKSAHCRRHKSEKSINLLFSFIFLANPKKSLNEIRTAMGGPATDYPARRSISPDFPSRGTRKMRRNALKPATYYWPAVLFMLVML